MSTIPAGGYGMVSRRVMRMSGVSKEAKAVHALLCSYTGDKDYCYPTVETLAKDLETSERSIIRWTEELKTKGLVDKVKLSGNQRRTAYIPLFPDSLKGDTSDTNQQKGATPDTIGALNHDTGDIRTSDTHGTLVLTGNTNTPENNNTVSADDNPLSRKLSGIPEPVVEQLEAYRKSVTDFGQLGRLLVPITEALALVGAEILTKALAQVVHESRRPGHDPQYSPRNIVKLLRDEQNLRARAAKYQPLVTTATESIDYDAETIRELETMTDTERIARFEWYAQNYLTPPEEARKRWKHLMPNEQNLQISGESKRSPQCSVA